MPARYWFMPVWPTRVLRLKPSCLMIERFTSTIRTLSITCSGPAMLSMLITFSGLLTKPPATRTALSAEAASGT